MDFNFTGSSRPERRINLGGTTKSSASQLAANARELRANRQALKQRTAAAVKIQAAFRGHLAAAHVRRGLGCAFDDCIAKVATLHDWHTATRLLIFSLRTSTVRDAVDARRLGVWARTMLSREDTGLDAALLALVASRMIHQLAHHAAAIDKEDAAVMLHTLDRLLKTGPKDVRQHYALRLLASGMHAALRSIFLACAPETPAGEVEAIAARLALEPLALFPEGATDFAEDATSNVSPRSACVRALVADVLTTPLLLFRMPAASAGAFAAALPCAEVAAHVVTLGVYYDVSTGDDALVANPIHSPDLLATLAALTTVRVPTLNSSGALSVYLGMFTTLQNALPDGMLGRDESDDSETLHEALLDARTLRQMSLLVSDHHLRAVLAASSCFSTTRPALCAFLLATLQAWPSSVRVSVLTTVLSNYETRGGTVVSQTGALVRELWRGWVRSGSLARRIHSGDAATSVHLAHTRSALQDGALGAEWPMLIVLCMLYSRCLLTLSDDEFYPALGSSGTARNPLTLDELVTLSGLLRNVAFAMYWDDSSNAVRVPGTRLSLLELRDAVTRLLQQLYTRDTRRSFTPEGHWHMLSESDVASFVQTVVLEDEAVPDRLSARTRAFVGPRLGVLNHIPFVIPFEVRVEVFRQFVRNDVERLGLARDVYGFPRRHRVTVRRTAVAEDGMAQLNGLGPRLKEPLEIVFVDPFGQVEAGIDGGGVFKEFLTTLVKTVFDTDRGLWCANAQQELYPNSHRYAQESEQLVWYTFLGRILGKALYEGLLVDVKFAGFFLSKWLGPQSYLDDVASLASLDVDLYRGLMTLKNYTGDVENDFALNFTVVDEEFGERRTTELVPGGAGIQVTRENRLSYICLVARYRLSTQIEPQCRAFFRGLSELIEPRWLRLLNRDELRVLVSGTDEPIDLADLRAHTVYGGYHEKDLAVTYFWEALESLDPSSLRAFLRFVTSSPNPPLLGFGELRPQFAIRHAGDDPTRLPTASTCVNLLKLPAYTSREQCLSKLRYAIHAGAGFDLS